MIVFTDNRALDNGGALSIVNPVELNISDAIFSFNAAESGGAVRVASTSSVTSNFRRCRFERNNATFGGAVRFDGKGQRTLEDCLFQFNAAGENSPGGASSVVPNRVNDTKTLTGDNDCRHEHFPGHAFPIDVLRLRSDRLSAKEHLRFRERSESVKRHFVRHPEHHATPRHPYSVLASNTREINIFKG